jgi:hypothetical protein
LCLTAQFHLAEALPRLPPRQPNLWIDVVYRPSLAGSEAILSLTCRALPGKIYGNHESPAQ